MDNITKILLTGLIVYWFICFVYMLKWHADHGNLSFGTILLAMIAGPVIALVLKYDNSWRDGDSLDYHGQRTREKLEANIRALEDIRRRYDDVPIINNTPSRGRITPSEVRAEWRRQNGITKIKDFKFFRE